MLNLIIVLVMLTVVWAIVDSWKRELFLWSVVWSVFLVYGIYVWTLL